MQIEKFEAVVKKGNNKGVGFISMPKTIRSNFEKDSQLLVFINSDINFYAKARHYSTLGFYLPSKFVEQHNLLNNSVKVEIKNIDGFYTSIGSDGRFYIPQKIAEKFLLKNNDIIEVEVSINDTKEIIYPMVNVRVKRNSAEYMCLFNKHKAGSTGVFNVIRKLKFPIDLNFLLNGLYAGKIHDDTLILYFGNHHSVFINNKVGLNDIAHYLGCYFADGTKRGNNWGICASTFEQANYYYKMHQFLIKDSKIVPTITFTDTENKNEQEVAVFLKNLWKNNVHLLTNEVKVRIIKSQFKPSLKTHKFGCLVIKENRQLTQIYYNRLLQFLFNEVKSKQNKELAIDFICGVLEGDGSVGPGGRGHLVITSNTDELKILQEIIKYVGIKCHLKMESQNRGGIHIGLLEVIRNISILKDKIFQYYPKRRNLLKERLLNTASVRVILGQNKKTSNWLIGQFNEMGILDGKGNLTKFGLQIKKDLIEFSDK